VALLLLMGGTARAEAQRVLLVAPPRGLEPAVRTALSPWPIEIRVTGGEAGAAAGDARRPGATMPGSAERARALAVAHGAGAVVWLSDDGAGGHALWIYDADSDRATARPLVRPPPYDEPTAAAVALTVKTLLRHSSVAPPVERYGAGAARPTPTPHLLADTLASLRIRRTGAGDVEPRVGVGVRVAPGRLAAIGAVAAAVHIGPGVSVDAPAFTGQLSDVQVSAALLARIPLRRALELWPRLGGSLHVTAVEGAVTGQVRRARVERVNPGLDTGAALELVVRPWLRASLVAGGSYALRRQIYLVAGEPVLSIPRVELEIGAALSVSLR
jgi:hypothetical protein